MTKAYKIIYTDHADKRARVLTITEDLATDVKRLQGYAEERAIDEFQLVEVISYHSAVTKYEWR